MPDSDSNGVAAKGDELYSPLTYQPRRRFREAGSFFHIRVAPSTEYCISFFRAYSHPLHMRVPLAASSSVDRKRRPPHMTRFASPTN
jgi:hypothetical protein